MKITIKQLDTLIEQRVQKILSEKKIIKESNDIKLSELIKLIQDVLKENPTNKVKSALPELEKMLKEKGDFKFSAKDMMKYIKK